jgi:hypothetical protein
MLQNFHRFPSPLTGVLNNYSIAARELSIAFLKLPRNLTFPRRLYKSSQEVLFSLKMAVCSSHALLEKQ